MAPLPSDCNSLCATRSWPRPATSAQLWCFGIDGDVLHVSADRSRALPTIDPHGRELLISCAETVHLVRVALQHFGYHPGIHVLPDLTGSPGLLAIVRLGQRGEPPATRDLFDAMLARHSNRHPYHTRPVPDGELAGLAAAAAETAWLQPLTDRKTIAVAADLIAEGDRIKWRGDVFRHELAERTIPNRGRRRDGMPGYAFGVPGPLARLTPLSSGTSTWAGCAPVPIGRSPLTTPVLAVIGTAHDDPPAWMAAGQAMSHVLLRATAGGLATSFLCQAIEVPAPRPRLASLLSGDGYLNCCYASATRAVHPTPRHDAHSATLS